MPHKAASRVRHLPAAADRVRDGSRHQNVMLRNVMLQNVMLRNVTLQNVMLQLLM
jgi:hypothetical protein